ncbi:MAG: LacI family transcriptional regulator [Provencibacterium sp.]|jgi:DNA-binding LacI/PurR family transcriptional regulator|nr:LacI family transcriptional regulator [Provencibacterium sp.]
MGKVTAADIAKACGVSQATVSYVLNDRPDKSISSATREKILAAARELNYYPNVNARSMRMSKAMSIGVVVGQDSMSLSFNKALKGIKQALYQNGYSITLLPDDEPSDRAQYISYYLSRRIDGLLFLYTTLDLAAEELLGKYGLPHLVINEAGISGCGIRLHTGLRAVIQQCVHYCRQHGFVRNAYFSFGATTQNPAVTRKIELLREYFQQDYPCAGLTEEVFARGMEEEALFEAIDAALERLQPQLVFTPLPRLSMATEGRILRRCFQLPQTVKLISLYDSRYFDALYPSVTHLEFPLGEMGVYACECLLAALHGREPPIRSFSCSLKAGMSTLDEGGRNL